MVENQQMSNDEQIGFHKGALSTLAKEREEMTKVVKIVEQLMQMHVSALKELGVDLQAQAEDVQQQNQAPEQTSSSPKNLDDALQ